MPCCKAEEYGWCSEQDTVYTDEKGIQYCVFHAPQEKGQTPENFNKIVYKRLQNAIDCKEDCDFKGTIFPWKIKFNAFNKKNALPKIDFSDTKFNGIADFTETAFNGIADFSGAAFSKNAGFYRAAFGENADFYKAKFRGNADFGGAAFSKKAGFDRAVFGENADFYEAKFRGIADFSGTAFSKNAGFKGAVFGENAIFYEAKFRETADFDGAAFIRNASFNRAVFGENASFLNSAFSGDAFFNEIDFSREVYFGGVSFNGRTYLKKATFSGVAHFTECSVEQFMKFEEVDLTNVSFLDSDPLMIHFTGCRWPKIFMRNALFDEINSKRKQESMEKVENLYRKLKQKYKGEYNEPAASNWHYGEKEMFRKKMKLRRFNPISFSNLYWASSGYGECALRAGIVLIFLLSFVTILMNAFGLVSASGQEIFGVKIIKGFSMVIEWKKFWLLIYNTIQNVLFIGDTLFKPQTLPGAFFLTITAKLIIPIQATLFVLALRNKFRR